jgi:uncharacterized protein Smg (DUF494 family)
MFQNYPFQNLKSFKHKKVIDGNAVGVIDFYKKVIEDQFKNIECIEQQHDSIIRYINEASPTFFIRLYGSFKRSDYNLQRRGFLTQYLNGTKTVFCDNTFTLIFSGMKLAGIPYTCGDLDSLLNQKKLIVGFAQVSQEKTLSYYSTKDAIRFDLNTLGWYQAHIHPVGKGYNGLSLKNYFPNPDRSEYNLTSKKRILDYNLSQLELDVLKAHFIRLIHPFNSFLVPKKSHLEYEGSNIGEESELINYVKDRIKEAFPKSYSEFESYSLLENENSVMPKRLNNIRWFSKKRIDNKVEKSVVQSKKIVNSTNDLKIGKYVQKSFKKLFDEGKLTNDEILNLQKSDYCKRVFNAGFEVLRKSSRSKLDHLGRPRYYAKEITPNYWLSSQWYENQRELFLKWMKSI